MSNRALCVVCLALAAILTTGCFDGDGDSVTKSYSSDELQNLTTDTDKETLAESGSSSNNGELSQSAIASTDADSPESDSGNMKHIPFPEEEEEEEDDSWMEYNTEPTIEIPTTWKRLSEEHEIWLNTSDKQVIFAGEVCLLRGALEMFICPFYCHKDHESVIRANVLPSQVHSALIALGVQPGQTVRWNPEYVPANGPRIKFTVMWKQDDEIKKINGKELVRNFQTKKELEEDFIFGGSIFVKSPDTGKEFYIGDDGEFVCVSNFSGATFDIPVESLDSTGNLMFEANTEKIPPARTKVYVVVEQIKETK